MRTMIDPLVISNLNLRRPTVYIWLTDKKECLYVGASMMPFRRILNHHVIDRLRRVEETDTISFYFCLTESSMIEMERNFIEGFKPKYNRQFANSNARHRILSTVVVENE